MRQDIKEKIEQIKNGQVPQGYTQTKFGIFPIDWRGYTFNGLFDFKGSLGIPRDQLSATGIPYLHYGDMHTTSKTYIDLDKFEKTLPKLNKDVDIDKYQLNNGDIVFVDASEDYDGTTKTFVIYNKNNKPFISGLHTFVAKEKEKAMHINYKKYFMFNECIKKQFYRVVQGYKVYGINRNNLKLIELNLPKLSEQEKIASVLEEWDKAIELKTSLIEKLKTQKKALMQKLLAPKPDWQKVKLGDILHERNEYMQKGQSLTHVTLSKEGVVDKTERYERDFLVKDEEKKYKITKFNDICYNPANLKFGVICRNNYGSAIFSPIYVTYEVKNDNDPMFVEHFITRKDFINQVRKYEQGTVYERMAVHSNDFLNFKTSIPKPEQQQKIAEVLSMADEQIKLQQKELEQLEKQKKALMQLLLTGIVRVN